MTKYLQNKKVKLRNNHNKSAYYPKQIVVEDIQSLQGNAYGKLLSRAKMIMQNTIQKELNVSETDFACFEAPIKTKIMSIEILHD